MNRTERRAAMPKLTWWFDQLAEAFGQEVIDQAQRDAIQRGKFFASENGYTIGEPPVIERFQTADEWLAQSARIKKYPALRGGDEEANS